MRATLLHCRITCICWTKPGLLGVFEKYSPNKLRQRAASPKFLVHNNAILSGYAAFAFQSLRADLEHWGRWVESAIGAHLLNQAFKYSELQLYYWREGNYEVDFVLEYRGKAVAIEVKSGPQGRFAGLHALHKLYPDVKSFVVGAGGMPWEEFLKIDALQLF